MCLPSYTSVTIIGPKSAAGERGLLGTETQGACSCVKLCGCV